MFALLLVTGLQGLLFAVPEPRALPKEPHDTPLGPRCEWLVLSFARSKPGGLGTLPNHPPALACAVPPAPPIMKMVRLNED